ncbi:MAG: hypothetical protein WHU95_07410 [candidate division WOR-3 bacterium]|jgi:hypothetical protein|nr:hypothetical protein [candidate division WOR-3 bacterium]MDH7519498.1 hypothetical protein [bacterium]
MSNKRRATEGKVKKLLWGKFGELNPNIHFNEDGYVKDVKVNLLDDIPEDALNLIIKELEQGGGQELKKKFFAIHSSAALVVNVFGYWKKCPDRFKFLGHTGFILMEFEKKLPTGLQGTPPNLDLFLENDKAVFGIESKFTEILTTTKAEFSRSYCPEKLPYLKGEFFEIINEYENQKLYLDVAQLIRHSIGLIKKYQGEKEIHLVYLYWLPQNYQNFEKYENHNKELAEFSEKIKKTGINFISMSYLDLWDDLSKDESNKPHIEKVKDRYLIEV